MLVLVVPGTHLSPHHAAAGSDAAVSPLVSFPVPALPEPQQPPRSAESVDTAGRCERWDASSLDYLATGEAVSMAASTRRFCLTLKEICLMGFDIRLVRREKKR